MTSSALIFSMSRCMTKEFLIPMWLIDFGIGAMLWLGTKSPCHEGAGALKEFANLNARWASLGRTL